MQIYEFGKWRVDATERLLLRSGAPVPLTPKAFDTLLLLVENAGHLVTKEQFMDRVWPGTFVEDIAVAQNISHIRRVLQLPEADGLKIETVPKRGYRLLGEVRKNLAELERQTALASPSRADSDTPRPRPDVEPRASHMEHSSRQSPVFRHLRAFAALCAALALIGVVGFAITRHVRALHAAAAHTSARSPLAAGITPLISLPGEQGMPAYSPDGSRIAFRWQHPNAKKSGIYAVVADSQSLLRLSYDEADTCPIWSPDGRFIAFVRTSEAAFSIYLVPALGGEERRLYTGSRIPWVGPEGISFSPDGKLIAFAEWSPEARTSSIKLLSVADSAVRALTSPPTSYHDAAPAFSPDGERVAFVRTTGPIFLDELYVIRLSGGEPRQLTFDHHRLFGSLLWTKDGKDIFFASNRAGLKSLWRIPAGGGTPSPVLGPGPVADHPSISSSTGELAYEYSVEDENLWRVDRSGTAGERPRSPLFSAKSSNLMPQFSPDGRKLAFEGDRSGYEEIWICDPDGSKATQVTHLERFSGSPRWSPDGRMLAFDSRREEHSGIFLVDIARGTIRNVPTFADADSVVPSWSRDGQWIYFASDRGTKTFHVWKVSVSGGVPIQVTRNGGFAAFESPDGKFVYYTRLSEPGIWRVPKNGGAESRIWFGPGPDNFGNWALTSNAIYLTVSERGKRSVIERLDLATKHLSPVSTLDRPAFYGLTVSPSSIVYSQRDRDEHDVVTTKLFQ